MKIIEQVPCQSCPYRKGAPVGLWDPQHFLELYVAEMSQTGAMYGCHKYGKRPTAEQSFCAGWLLDQRRRGVRNIGLRMYMADDRLRASFEQLDAGGLELYPDVGSMCAANGVPVPPGDPEDRAR